MERLSFVFKLKSNSTEKIEDKLFIACGNTNSNNERRQIVNQCLLKMRGKPLYLRVLLSLTGLLQALSNSL